MDNKQLIKQGFNNGYLLRKSKPQLAKTLEKSLADQKDSYSQAIVSGMKQFDQDKGRDRSRVYGIEKLTSLSKSKSKDKDMPKIKD